MARIFMAIFMLMTSMALSAAASVFGDAKWIALESDSTILFPHIHLLSPQSEQGKSLKAYKLPMLSKSFHIESHGGIKKATAYICGLGQYDLSINGERIGEYFLSPGWTMYNRRLLYNEFDISDSVLEALARNDGNLDVKVILGTGMYDVPVRGYHKFAGSCGAPKLIMAIEIEYEDGTLDSFITDETWMAEESGILYSSIFAGEEFDAGFRGTPRQAIITQPIWNVPLEKQQRGTFIKIRQTLPAHKISEGLFDMGQNFSGIIQIKVKGKEGKSIRIRPAEILRDGKVYQRCAPDYEWKYTLKSTEGQDSVQTWRPLFTYTGYRYVEVILDEDVELLEMIGLHTSTDARETGHFECSDSLLCRIHDLIDWAIRSNLTSISTDCPTREKLGWQEQNHLMGYSMMYRYDMQPLFNKIVDDLADSQHHDGAIPTIAPEYTVFKSGSGFEDTPEWGASFILCPYYTYLWYGDTDILKRHYSEMKKYINYLDSRSEDGILDYGLGDWFDVGPGKPGKAQLTSVALSATAMFYHELCTMVKIAEVLGESLDAEMYSSKADFVKQAFNKKFYNSETKVYENGSQTGLAMALYMDLVTDETRSHTLSALLRNIEENDYALTSGDIGFRYLIQALQKCGRSDMILKMNSRDDIPGYAYQLKKGATALTESWQAYDNVSNNHLMLGHLMEWLYSGLGGIRQMENSVAWEHILIDPQMVGDIKYADTELETPKGKVCCKWTRDISDGSWVIEAVIPAKADATVNLPDGRTIFISEGHHKFSSIN